MSLDLFDGVAITFEMALSAATGSYGAWNAGLWDTATWGPDVIWTDVSSRVRSFTTDRRFSRELQAWEAGQARVVVDNRDGALSPENLAGPYVTAGVTAVRPLRPARLRATYAGATSDLYRGYALDFQETWDGQFDAEVAIPCSDEFARLAAVDGFATAAVGGGETSGKRIHRILDAAGHTGDRCVDDGRVTVQPTTLAANTLTELQLTTDSEGGSLWVEPDGCVTFEHQYALLENARSNTVQATFSDGTGAELPCHDIQAGYGADLIRNIAAFTRVGGTVQTAADATSRALYGDRREAESRSALICESDPQVKGLADFFVAQRKDPERRFTQITIKARGNPVRLFPQVLGRRVRDLIRVIRRPPSGVSITRDCFIAGIHHQVTGDDWITTFDLWSATAYTGFASSRWDTGLWDTATWFY